MKTTLIFVLIATLTAGARLAYERRGTRVVFNDHNRLFIGRADAPATLRDLKELLQIEIAVLENGRRETAEAVFCRSEFRYSLRNWDIDEKVDSLHDEEVSNWIFYLRWYGQARNCWNGPPGTFEEAIGRGEHILAFFDPLRIADLDGIVLTDLKDQVMAFQIHH